MSRRLRKATRIVVAAVALPVVGLVVGAAATPLPPELGSQQALRTSTVVRDRDGTVMREVASADGRRSRWLALEAMGDALPRALIAAEDRRFYRHVGIDPLATLRAAGQLAWHRRVVSGGSTLTQQLARTLVPRERSLLGKAREAALALRIEASLGKRAILEAYLNDVTFAPGLVGVETASRALFDKPPAALSLGEAAALVSLPRGPSLYDPRRGTARALRRRDRVLARMERAGLATPDEVARAVAEPLVVAAHVVDAAAPHLVRAVLRTPLDAGLGALGGRANDVTLTIDRRLQREIEGLARERVGALAASRVGSAAVVVLDNATSEILAYVGSADFRDVGRGGENDAALARRQPGSALKPFVYELAMERLGFTPATALPDVEIALGAKEGSFRPHDYDGRFHGPVRLREALGSSYNVPAVWTAAALGPARVVERLRDLGFETLDEAPAHYGDAIALGDGEVRLVDLANAYATLARGGVLLPLRAVRAARDAAGRELSSAAPPGRRVLAEAEVSLVTDMLSDRSARVAAFGEGNALELPFDVAAKTGTSKGYRDNVAVGYSSEVTVAVWVGNMDGAPMEGVSGITGAGPLFHDAMLAAMRDKAGRALSATSADVDEIEVCALSGEVPTRACPHSVRERFVRGHVPRRPCGMHEEARVERESGLLAGPACKGADVEVRTFERFDGALLAWARAAGRPLLPTASSPRCPAPAVHGEPVGRLRVAYPTEGAVFALDPSLAGLQAIGLRAEGPAAVTRGRFVVDGRPLPTGEAPFMATLDLVPGEHVVRIEAEGAPAEDGHEVRFSVE